MSLLLDTHALIWWFLDSPLLGARARATISIAEAPIFVSAVSAFEISTKVRIGKLPQAAALDDAFEAFLAAQRFTHLPVSVRHGREAGALSIPHGDPFDRLLIAQALVEGLVLVSNEAVFDAAGVQRLW